MRHTLFALASVSALVLGGCAATQMTPAEAELAESMDASKFQPSTREMRDNIETQPLLAQATFWQREYDLNPGDLESAIKFASTVRRMGNPERAVEITQTTRALYPKDPYLVAEFAAALIASERGGEALPVVETTLRTAPGYARLWSLRGAALDQAERFDDARKSYERALSITPYDPNVLANMGLSYALEGDAATAEQWLVKAAAIPGASQSVTRNLDLVRQLQGKSTPERAPQAQADAQLPPSPVSAAPSNEPTRTFRVFNDGEARSAADAARMMAGQSGRKVLRAEDPDALGRLARNASPARRALAPKHAAQRAGRQSVQRQVPTTRQLSPTPARAPAQTGSQARSPFAPQAPGQIRHQQPSPQTSPQGYAQPAPNAFRGPVPPTQGAYPQSRQAAPQGYPAAYPQGAAPYPQAPAGYPQPVQQSMPYPSSSQAPHPLAPNLVQPANLPRGRARPRR